ncbi:MAG: carbamate kinase [Lachnospiraceae bacterium]|nr:carbamate kinase [Lachnospiraceae bacterium]
MGKKIVIALGGNALGNSAEEQLRLVKNTANAIVDLIEDGNTVIIGHGNGPQVGMINKAMEFSAVNGGDTPNMPFPECGAMSQGYIGYHLQQALREELKARNIDREVASVITQVVVDPEDKAFLEPTKPIGAFLSEEEAKKMAAETGYLYKQDSGRGYRRVVASPAPLKIVEINVIANMVEEDMVVISAGGGGIPVIEKEDGSLEGIAAVIDKDKTCAKLADDLDADLFIILTAVDYVYINYNKPDEQKLEKVSLETMKKYIKEGHFAKGSMLPKVEACLQFVENGKNREAIITSLEKAGEATTGSVGTRIEGESDMVHRMMNAFRLSQNA